MEGKGLTATIDIYSRLSLLSRLLFAVRFCLFTQFLWNSIAESDEDSLKNAVLWPGVNEDVMKTGETGVRSSIRRNEDLGRGT